MENNNIVTAPQIADVQSVYGAWCGGHTGSLSEFIDFMTSPTEEREDFIASLGVTTEFCGSALAVTIKTPTT